MYSNKFMMLTEYEKLTPMKALKFFIATYNLKIDFVNDGIKQKLIYKNKEFISFSLICPSKLFACLILYDSKNKIEIICEPGYEKFYKLLLTQITLRKNAVICSDNFLTLLFKNATVLSQGLVDFIELHILPFFDIKLHKEKRFLNLIEKIYNTKRYVEAKHSLLSELLEIKDDETKLNFLNSDLAREFVNHFNEFIEILLKKDSDLSDFYINIFSLNLILEFIENGKIIINQKALTGKHLLLNLNKVKNHQNVKLKTKRLIDKFVMRIVTSDEYVERLFEED